MALTIDDTVNQAAPPGFRVASNVHVVPRYLAGVFEPDGSNTLKVLNYTDASGHQPNQQTMAPAVSFDFPQPEIFTQSHRS